jgi:fructuronate reductase
MESNLEEVGRYEDMKLRTLYMGHSIIGHLGVLLGYRGKYGVYQAMQDEDIREIIERINRIATATIQRPASIDPRAFAAETVTRLSNPNIPDDPMRIALNGSTKISPRFMATYYEALSRGMDRNELDALLLPVAAFLRYTMGCDDMGLDFTIEQDPIRDDLLAVGSQAMLGAPETASVFSKLLLRKDIMGADLLAYGNTMERILNLVGHMLSGKNAVRETLRKQLGRC